MIGRYRIVRGRRPPDEPLPEGIRQDTRKHTRHVLRPETGMVRAFLAHPDAVAWRRFAVAYRRLLATRHAADPQAFAALADLARQHDVWLGCNCPTAKNPDVQHCHTVLALECLGELFPGLEIVMPRTG
jgi:uncharacterized protein YeaO (DUF488 family)